MPLIAIPWFCVLVSFGSGVATYSECRSEQHHAGAKYLVSERVRVGRGICGIVVHGTESTAWPTPVDGWVPCWMLNVRHQNEQSS